MSQTLDAVRASIIQYCSIVGADPLLVQGTGGNVSWKDGDTLWVKASGAWLAEAARKDVFVPVDLSHLRIAIESGDFSVIPRPCAGTTRRPSIETLLHALMPQRVVVHLHAVEILTHLVRDNCLTDFQTLIDSSVHWGMVDYHKPGASLAAAVSALLVQEKNIDVIFLKNHGVVIGGADVVEVNCVLSRLISVLSTAPASIGSALPILSAELSECAQYVPLQDVGVHQLALNVDLFDRLSSDWALYPDHVVFLGSQANAYSTWESFREKKVKTEQPELVFIQGKGVFVRPDFSKAKQAQLRCYFDVLSRQGRCQAIRALTDVQISELLNWDAEQFRMNLSKQQS